MSKFITSPYLQRVTERFPVEGEILSICVKSENEFYVSTDNGLLRFVKGEWNCFNNDIIFNKIYCDEKGRLFASRENELYIIDDKGAKLLHTFEYPVTDMCFSDKLYVLTLRSVNVETEDGFICMKNTEQESFSIAVYNGRICCSGKRCIQRIEGKRNTWRCIFPEHSTMPRITINTIAFDKTGYLLVGAKEGFYIYDYKSGWYSHKEIPILPEEEVFSIDVCDDGAFILGTQAGAVLIRYGLSKYLPATRYAFDTNVTQVVSCGGNIYTASKGGIIKISEKEMTLKEKADFFFEYTEKYFPRKDGFITGKRVPLEEGTSSISDNDGLWTQMYLCALCMWYSITKDEKILETARRYKDAMLVLTRAPGIKGFTARAVRYPDEKDWGKGLEEQREGEEWHRSADGTYEWLGETSSDEMTGHYAGFSLYYDLCANEEEKAEIRKAVCDITDHILEHDGYLFDCDGKPTSWACWNENALNNDSMWMWEKGVNSLEMLNFLKISHHMSGDEKYIKKYNELIRDHHFIINAAYHKRADGHCCHIDDNLAMLNSLNYLRLEKDPAIRQYILMGLAAHYNYEKIEQNPYFAFIYTAYTGAPCDVDNCIKTLQDYPMDLRSYKMVNSTRKNLETDDEPVYWGEAPRIKYPLAWDERPISTLGLHAFRVDGGDPNRINSGMTYLFIYWLGRFLEVFE